MVVGVGVDIVARVLGCGGMDYWVDTLFIVAIIQCFVSKQCSMRFVRMAHYLRVR